MKKVKVILVIVLIPIFMISTTACNKYFYKNDDTSTSSKRITHEDVKKKVINEATEYLKKNYPDDKFTFVSAASPNWADNYYKVGFKTKKYNNKQVIVYGCSSDKQDDDGFTIYTYSDDYYQYYMNEDAEKYFYDLSKKYFDEDIVIKVAFPTSLGFTKAIKIKETFAENFKDGCVNIYLYVFSEKKHDEIKNKFKSFLNCLIDNNIYTSVTYVHINNLSYIRRKNIDYIIDNSERYNIERYDYSTYNGVIKEY